MSEREEKVDPKQNSMENLVAAVIVVAIVGAIVAWVMLANREAPREEQRLAIPLGGSPSLGSPDAPVKVIVFSDFECPFCGEFARDEFPAIGERLVSRGEVEIFYKHFPLDSHPRALPAAQAAMCAQDQDRFWEYHDLLYANQDALEVGNLESYARELGLDMDLFRSCLMGGQHRADVLRDKQVGIDSAVTGTPTFFFNGRRVVGFLSADEFAREVSEG